MIRSASRPTAAIAFVLGLSTSALAQPSGYYDTADTSSASALRSSLHEIIDDHVRYPYTSSATDTWDILDLADENPSNSSHVLDVYKNASYPKAGGGNSNYNREHSWPKSYGFPDDGSSNYPYTDCHHLFVADSGYNSSRSNKPYAYSTGTEKPTDSNAGRGGSGDSNWTDGSGSTGSWETWGDRRGDVARALLYMDVRYEGGTHGGTGHSEPDLILTDDRSLIASSNTGDNESVGYMGLLSVLLEWHEDDPVDAFEVTHHETVYSFQGNRNPFVDHPEWVDVVFGTGGGGGGTGGGGGASVWINEFHYDDSGSDQGEFVEVAGPAGTDLSGWSVLGYNGTNGTVYKPVSLSGTISNQSGGYGTVSVSFSGMQNGAPDGLALVDDQGTVLEFISYEGSFTATSGAASGMTSTDIGVAETGSTAAGDSLQRTGSGATAGDFSWTGPTTDSPGGVNAGQSFTGGGGGSTPDPWINEFHYDDSGADEGEFVEVAGPAGTDLSGWSVVGYNGSGGGDYKTVSLSGSIPNQSNGYGTVSVAFSGMQNGAPDGLALIDDQGAVVEFISYEGSFTATSGAAQGETSTDVGVAETSSTAAGQSLQRTGSGSEAGDFTWSGPSTDSPGSVNGGQSFN